MHGLGDVGYYNLHENPGLNFTFDDRYYSSLTQAFAQTRHVGL